MGYQVVDGAVVYPPLSAENRAKLIEMVSMFDQGKGVTIADLRRVSPLSRLETINALNTLAQEKALVRTVRSSNGGVSFEYFSVPGVSNG
jgi:hypothetical protein